MKVKTNTRAFNRLCDFFYIQPEYMEEHILRAYRSTPEPEETDTGLIGDYLDEGDLYDMTHDLIQGIFGREARHYEPYIVAAYLEDIELI